MPSSMPRVVIVTRATDYEQLLAQHATRSQADFFLKSRGQSLQEVESQHLKLRETVQQTISKVPSSWRMTHISRNDLDRFLFEPSDTIVIVGQDGLVANVAKYLDGQPVLGINPDPDRFEGILVPLNVERLADILEATVKREIEMQQRTIVQAEIDDGQSIIALNELFIGHQSHQSARYRIYSNKKEERHSSSGLIVSTGTGCSGWARSISESIKKKVRLPKPEENKLVFFVREAFPSVATGTSLVQGIVSKSEQLLITSEMNNGGVIFGDGIESDYIPFDWGKTVKISASLKKLHLVR